MSNSRFLLDENIPIEVKEFLEFRGFSAEYVPKGVVNGKVALLAKDGKLVLLSRDTDFLNADLFPPKEFSRMKNSAFLRNSLKDSKVLYEEKNIR